MYILQISDLHISATPDLDILKKKIKLLGDQLSNVLSKDDQLVCCLLGDIIDQGVSAAYSVAKDVIHSLIDRLKELVGEDCFATIIVPGNHDLCEKSPPKGRCLDDFNIFSTELLGRKIKFSDDNPIHELEYFGYRFICASSVLYGETKFGQINFDALTQCCSTPGLIMLTHHALVSGDSTDGAPIRDGYRLQKYLEDQNVIALLHGHTHGCKRYTVGHDCQVVGVGPMFKVVPDVSNQCNLISVSGSSVRSILTLTYQGDRETWDITPTFQRNADNHYCGSSAYELYQRLLGDADSGRPLENLKFQIHQRIDTFKEELEANFSAGLEEAQVWQSFNHPDYLSYTHGELMNSTSKSWYDFIISTLKKNHTSKRAIIPLITREMAYRGGDGELVSFDIVQFGFPDNNCQDLHITVYLRALEINHFLPLNLCETYLMAQRLTDEFPDIAYVTICLFAFRAEAKPNYGCYKRAQIDLVSESQLCKWVMNDLSTVKKLLLEKANMGDTVIEDKWLVKLENALEAFYNKDNQGIVLEQTKQVRKFLEILKCARQRCSNYSETQEQEDAFVQALKNLTDMISEM